MRCAGKGLLLLKRSGSRRERPTIHLGHYAYERRCLRGEIKKQI